MYLSVGEISKTLGISNEMIRYYVQEGIISPHKNPENNYWEYSSDDFIRLSDVLFYRSVGLSVQDIKSIMKDGMPIEQIGDVIKSRRAELINTIKDIVTMMQRLDEWEEFYRRELDMMGRFEIGDMPVEYRRLGYIDENKHIASALRECFNLEKDDWMNLSVSFCYNTAEPEKGLRKYFSFRENTRLKLGNNNADVIEKRADNCLITEVFFSDDAEKMISPLLTYAEENNIKLTGIIYGREDTNFFRNGTRTGLYSLYAPIAK